MHGERDDAGGDCEHGDGQPVGSRQRLADAAAERRLGEIDPGERDLRPEQPGDAPDGEQADGCGERAPQIDVRGVPAQRGEDGRRDQTGRGRVGSCAEDAEHGLAEAGQRRGGKREPSREEQRAGCGEERGREADGAVVAVHRRGVGRGARMGWSFECHRAASFQPAGLHGAAARTRALRTGINRSDLDRHGNHHRPLLGFA